MCDDRTQEEITREWHLYYEEPVLWEYGIEAVVRHQGGGPRADGKIKMVSMDSGFCDWPIFYDPWHAAWDFPERWSHAAKEAAIIWDLHDRGMDSELHEIRLQLCTMWAFMYNTPDDRENYDGSWWTGPMPHYLSSYNPKSWNEDNDPVHIIWRDYMDELRDGFDDYLELARELPVADLLAASREAGDWYDEGEAY